MKTLLKIITLTVHFLLTIYKNENDVHINVDVRIKVNKDGVFQGVMQKGKDGKETMISIDQWNKKIKSDENK